MIYPQIACSVWHTTVYKARISTSCRYWYRSTHDGLSDSDRVHLSLLMQWYLPVLVQIPYTITVYDNVTTSLYTSLCKYLNMILLKITVLSIFKLLNVWFCCLTLTKFKHYLYPCEWHAVIFNGNLSPLFPGYFTYRYITKRMLYLDWYTYMCVNNAIEGRRWWSCQI